MSKSTMRMVLLGGLLAAACESKEAALEPDAAPSAPDAVSCPPPEHAQADVTGGGSADAGQLRDAPLVTDAAHDDADPNPGRQSIDCEVVIVGGGSGGLHTAFRLAPELGEGVCLFEKQDRLGGRIYDVSKDGSPDSPRIGIGARRIMETQSVVFALADELGIEYAPAAPFDDVIATRGATGPNSDALNAAAFPTLPDDADLETTFYERLMEKTDVETFGDFRAYGRATVGTEGWQFLLDMSRFRADFQAPLDARG